VAGPAGAFMQAVPLPRPAPRRRFRPGRPPGPRRAAGSARAARRARAAPPVPPGPPAGPAPRRRAAAGGGYSTVGDLMRFAQALGSGMLISKATLAEATSQQQDHYGYGFTVGQEPVPNYGHSGGPPGMNGDLRVFPQLGYILVILSNQDPQPRPAPPTSSHSECPTNRRPAGS
jgi:CubicO group peptidase (beta-lactamase class C family)